MSIDGCQNEGCSWIFRRQCNSELACSNLDVRNNKVTCPYEASSNLKEDCK